MRRAPEGGYAFPEKEQYRTNVWSRFVQNCPVPRGMAQVLLMPSTEGLEIEVALRRGFREENIHAVDREPAIVATLKRKYPKINTYGVEIERACERIAKKGLVIHVANFDFTSCMGFSFADTLMAIGNTQVLQMRACWAVTLLRGRETCSPADLVSADDPLPTKQHNNVYGYDDCYQRLHQLLARRYIGSIAFQRTDALRVAFMFHAVDGNVEGRMLWAVFRPSRKRVIEDIDIGGLSCLSCLDLKCWHESLDPTYEGERSSTEMLEWSKTIAQEACNDLLSARKSAALGNYWRHQMNAEKV